MYMTDNEIFDNKPTNKLQTKFQMNKYILKQYSIHS